MDQKRQQALDMQKTYNVTRPILLDSLEGACHLAYGGKSNMTWIINKAGTIIYKAPWTDPESIESFLTYCISVNQRKAEGIQFAPFVAERLEFRELDDEKHDEALARGGPKAVKDYHENRKKYKREFRTDYK